MAYTDNLKHDYIYAEDLIENTVSNKPMNEEKEKEVLDRLEEYKERMIYEQNGNLEEDRA